MLMGAAGKRPSTHWKVTVAPSVVLATAPTVALAVGGKAGLPQSTRRISACDVKSLLSYRHVYYVY